MGLFMTYVMFSLSRFNLERRPNFRLEIKRSSLAVFVLEELLKVS